MAPTYKIALIQIKQKDAAVKENYAKAESYIRDAAAQGADLAVLPEYHLTSWCPEHPDFVSATIESASYVSRYQDLARELGINIVPGTICDVSSPSGEGEGEKEMRNMAYWISSDGSIAGSYQKKNLWHPERPHLAAGVQEPHAAFETPLTKGDGKKIKAGLLICWDLAFPEAFRALIADGADVIVIPSWWHLTDVDDEAFGMNPMCERAFLEAAVVTRAYENTAAVVFCNAGGLSQVAMPILGAVGGVMEAMDPSEGAGDGKGEGMKIVEVDFGVLQVAERNYKVRADMGSQGWHYGYTLWKGAAEKGDK
ncbi:carbon-nitrogen hydrolase [Echria macrotheca]|uniref:Carbon-nitrogen hydrolase n=1 Tax=Echria macrotheca TaxID=438768 RepID=A0AAJ0BEH3_9PEZI|nr:carbon-nitrogen hydrolase [Echria macrotheca]